LSRVLPGKTSSPIGKPSGVTTRAITRRFKIKTVKGIDDYAMIAEVVKRRYKYALRGEELWPDLVLIDGGLGHLRAADCQFACPQAAAIRQR